MARFQIAKNNKTGEERGFFIIPKQIWKNRGWKQGTYVEILVAMDGSLVIREGKR